MQDYRRLPLLNMVPKNLKSFPFRYRIAPLIHTCLLYGSSRSWHNCLDVLMSRFTTLLGQRNGENEWEV